MLKNALFFKKIASALGDPPSNPVSLQRPEALPPDPYVVTHAYY